MNVDEVKIDVKDDHNSEFGQKRLNLSHSELVFQIGTREMKILNKIPRIIFKIMAISSQALPNSCYRTNCRQLTNRANL